MATEILRIGDVSIGQFDDSNYYVAKVKIAGEGAKDAGQERLEHMTYYPCLHSCIYKAVDRGVRDEDAQNLKAWAAALERRTLDAIQRCNEAGKKLEAVWKKTQGKR